MKSIRFIGNLITTKFIYVVLLFVTSFVFGQTTRTATVNGNWSNTATWGGNPVPVSTDVVVIGSGVAVTVDVNDAVCSSLTINNGGGNGAIADLIFNSTSVLTVGGTVTLGSNSNRTARITMTSGGTLICNGLNLNLGGSGSGGSFVKGSGTVVLKTNNTLPVLYFNDFNNLTIDGGTTTLSTTTTISGVLTVLSNSTLNRNTRTVSSPTIVLENVGGGVGGKITGTSSLTLGGNITVNYSGSGAISEGAEILGPVVLGVTRTVTVNDDGVNNNDLSINGVISGTNFGITKSGLGTLILLDNNTYTGTTTVNSGRLRIGVSERISNSSNIVLNGGILSTGSGVGLTETLGTLQVNENSTIELGTGNHSLIFSNSSSISWTSGKTLTVTGWTGSGGSTGSQGKIFFGTTSSGLTSTQRNNVIFSGFPTPTIMLSTGECVPDEVLCSGTPNGGSVISNNNSVCGTGGTTNGFTLSLLGATEAANLGYQWQSSTDGITYTNIGGATNPQYSSSITSSRFYRCVVTCAGQSTNSQPLFIGYSATCYCESAATSDADSRINRVQFNTIDQISPNTCQKYTDYTSVSTNVIKGQQYTLTITKGTCSATNYSGFFGAWIDWNGDGVFTGTGEHVLINTVSQAAGVLSSGNTFTIPEYAILGAVRMRCIFRESAAPSSCGTYTYGETEDYTIFICSNPTITTQPTNQELCVGSEMNISVIAESPVETGNLSYQWQVKNGNSFQNIVDQTNSSLIISNITNNLNNNQYRCVISNGCGGTTITNVVTLTVKQPQVNLSVNSNEIQQGDYLWNGLYSDDVSEPLNWYVLGQNGYETAQSTPGSDKRVFIVNYTNNSNCVSESNSSVIPPSTSFNSNSTFIGENASLVLSNGSTLKVSGDFTNLGVFTPNNSTIEFFGETDSYINMNTNSKSFKNIKINKTSGEVKLGGDIIVTGDIIFTSGNLRLEGKELNLGTTGNLVGESENGYAYCDCPSAVIKSTGEITQNQTVALGNLGLSITSAVNMGTVTIERRHQKLTFPVDNEEVNTIERSYYVKDVSGGSVEGNGSLDATLVFNYVDNSGLTNLGIYRRPSGEVDWIEYGGTHDPVNKTVTINNWSSFSEVTIGEKSSPLPVELKDFYGKQHKNDNLIFWSTSSEKNSSHFIVESSIDGINWSFLTNVKGSGNSQTLINYSTIDYGVDMTKYYRLTQYDFDGQNETYHPIVIIRETNTKIIVKYVNILGQEVNPLNVNGIVFEIYSDGTNRKTIKY
jgi:autotransporter-associated beta strand protein